MIQYNAPHPGMLLREQMADDISVTQLAGHLRVARTTLTRLLNGTFGITAAMALRLAQAFPTTNERFWLNAQQNYDLWRASQEGQPSITPVRAA